MYIIKKLSDNSKEYLNTYYDLVDQLNKDMSGVESSKSISETYIKQTLPLHNFASQLSEAILKYTTNTDVESLAKNIIFEQNQDTEKLNNMLETCACVCNGERDIRLYMRRYNEIFDILIKKLNEVPTSNNLDFLYLTSLQTHNECFIAMAKNLLVYSICPEIKDLATDTIDSLTLQIKSIRTLLKLLT